MHKVVLVTDHLRPDGAQRQLAALTGGLQASGFSCVVCSLESGGDLSGDLRDQGIRVLEAGKQSRYDLFRLLGFLKETMVREKPHVLQSFLFYSNNLCRLAGRRAGVPLIVTSQRCTPYRRFIPLAALAIEQLFLGFSHATVINFPPPRRGRVRSPFFFIPNGVDTSRFRPRTPAGKGEGTRDGEACILTAGRLEPQKGHRVLFEAMALLRDRNVPARLCVAGEGPLRDELEAVARGRGLEDKVRFLGFRADVETLYPRADVVVNPSLFEGMPNAVMEAMACGRPVVATDVGGTSLILNNGVEGVLVPPEDAGALARGIEFVLKGPDPAADMARAARKRMEEEFSREKMVQRYIALYRELWGGLETRRSR